MWTIHSVGDAAFLEQILIAVAMVTGTGDFEKMASIGMLLGFLVIFFQSIMNGGREIQIGSVFVAWIFYALAFGNSTTVLIEDAYTGEVLVVDNVPIGPAAVGAVISNIGYSITDLFEQGYSYLSPGTTQTRFADSLRLINQVRHAESNPAVLRAMDRALGGGANAELSLNNYIRECTLTKMDLGQMSVQELATTPVWDAMRFDSDLFGTQINLSGTAQNVTCSEGYAALTNALVGIKGSEELSAAIEQIIGSASSDFAGSLSPTERLYDAMASLGETSVSAQDFVASTILRPIFESAAAGKYQDFQDSSSAIMINQAIQQRNTQWAAEQTMFMTTVRPMMTFFEGFVYAITPLAAFFLLMGRFGIGLVGKYLVTIAWIQLWMPVLSIINLYIHMSATAEIGGIENPFLTFHAMEEASLVTATWLATGGMLAAATPIITLFIITGSTYAMTSLAGRLGGGDHINEKIPTPDAVQPSAVMSMMPQGTFDQFRGLQMTGSESMIDKVNVGNMLSNAVSSSETASAQATDTFASQLSNSVFSGASADQSYSRLQGLGQALRSSGSTQAQAITGQAQDYARQYGLSQSHADAVSGAVALSATGTVDAGKLAGMFSGPGGMALAKGSPLTAQGSISGSADSRSTDTRQQMTSDIDRLAKNAGFSESDSAALTRDMARQVNQESGERFTKSLGEDQREQLSQTATQAVSAQQTYQRLASAQESIGTTSAMDMRALAGIVMGDSAAHQHLRVGMQTAPSETRQLAAEKADFYEGIGMDSARAQAGGQIFAMLNGANGSNRAIAAEAIAMGTGGQTATAVADFEGKQHLAERAPVVTYGDGAPSLAGPQRMTDEQRDQALSQVPGDEAVLQHHAENLRLVESADAQNLAGHRGERLDSLRSQIMNSQVERSTSSAIFATAEGAGRFFDQVVGGVGTGASGFSVDFSNSMQRLSEMTPEQRDQFVSDANRGDQYIQDEYGLPGYMATGAADLGRGIIGAGVSGYTSAKEWVTGESDLSEAARGMSIRERGAFFASALASASHEGAEHAQRFTEQYGHEFRQIATQTAIHEHGLRSEAGASLFASSLLGASDGREAEYREQLNGEFGGDTELAGKAADMIESAAGAGREQAGGYLVPVSRYLGVKG